MLIFDVVLTCWDGDCPTHTSQGLFSNLEEAKKGLAYAKREVILFDKERGEDFDYTLNILSKTLGVGVVPETVYAEDFSPKFSPYPDGINVMWHDTQYEQGQTPIMM